MRTVVKRSSQYKEIIRTQGVKLVSLLIVFNSRCHKCEEQMDGRQSISKIVRTLVIFSTMCLQGCLVLPVGGFPARDVIIIESELVDSISEQSTTKAQVIERLGAPDLILDDGHRLIYEVSMHYPGFSRWCFAHAGDIIADKPTEKCTKRDPDANVSVQILDMTFGAKETVEKKVETKIDGTLEGHACTEWGICESFPTYASSDDDQAAKRFVAELGQCAIYLYMSKAPNVIYVQVDETLPRTRFRSETAFLRFDLDSGVRKITFFDKNRYSWRWIGEFPASQGQLSETIELDCSNGNVFLMQGQFDEKNNLVITLVPDAEGRQEIIKRYLILDRNTASWQPGN